MDLSLQAILVFILVGGVAGWLAGMIVRGYGLGLVGNIVVGILGGFLFTWLAPKIGIAFAIANNEIITRIVYALIGAVILLLLVGLVRKAR